MSKTTKTRAKAPKSPKPVLSKRGKQILKQLMPYLAIFLVVLTIANIGAQTSNSESSRSLSQNSGSQTTFSVSVDQVSEANLAANIASSLNLSSKDDVAQGYMRARSMYESGQTATDRIEKPSIVNTNLSRGVSTYTVKAGETMESIAAQYGLTTDQIRWSNDLKTTDVSEGQTLVISAAIPGIIYTVKSGDTVESLASKYESSQDLIISANDLETTPLTEGMQIVLPNGVLPTAERPEYVAPVTYTYAYSYTYLGSSSSRQNVRIVSENVYSEAGNRNVAGQCTWYAWWWRAHDSRSPSPLPNAVLGNAYSWATSLAAYGYAVDRTPSVGAVFQTNRGWYGHVGVVLAVNSDGSILVRDMNYASPYVITEATIPASEVSSFLYIH